MLGTSEQLAAGLGAASIKKDKDKGKAKEGGGGSEEKEPDAVGNAPLRLWIGERFLGTPPLPFPNFPVLASADITSVARTELYKRMGKESKVKKQAAANRQMRRAVERVTNSNSSRVDGP